MNPEYNISDTFYIHLHNVCPGSPEQLTRIGTEEHLRIIIIYLVSILRLIEYHEVWESLTFDLSSALGSHLTPELMTYDLKSHPKQRPQGIGGFNVLFEGSSLILTRHFTASMLRLFEAVLYVTLWLRQRNWC